MYESGWSYGYAPQALSDPTPQPVQVQQVPQAWQPAPQHVPVAYPEWDLICDYCGEEIGEGEEAIEILRGIAGRGPKSGRAMVVESSIIDFPIASLHLWCVEPFTVESIYDEECEPEPIFCEKCGIEVEGESDD